MRLLSPLLSNALSAPRRRDIYAGQKWWSGAGSNRRPSAFQGLTLSQLKTPPSTDRAIHVRHQCRATIERGTRLGSS